MLSELAIIAHKPRQCEWRPQQDYPCIVNMSKCRGLCSCQCVFAGDSKLCCRGAGCASAALHHVKRQSGVWVRGAEPDRLSPIRDRLNKALTVQLGALSALSCRMCEIEPFK